MCAGAGSGWNWFQTFCISDVEPLGVCSISGGLDVYSTGVIMIVLSPDLNRVLLSSPHRIRLFIAQIADILQDISPPAAVLRTAIKVTHCTQSSNVLPECKSDMKHQRICRPVLCAPPPRHYQPRLWT